MNKLVLIAAASLVLAACDADDVTQLMNAGNKTQAVSREINSQQLARGASLFKNNCAACHGDQAQGNATWQKRDKDGKFPPPPLNGTGHAWHHPTDVLKYTINNGTAKIGGNMPAFAGKISNAEIDDILVFIQAKWPEPLYEAWYKNNQRAIKAKNK